MAASTLFNTEEGETKDHFISERVHSSESEIEKLNPAEATATQSARADITFFVRKSAPMVALYEVENLWLT